MQEIEIPVSNNLFLPARLYKPEKAYGLVLFAHGAGSSRLSERNNFVAKIMEDNQIASLLFDLLTEKEDQNYDNRFDINLISERLTDATRWAERFCKTEKLPFGYFGASTGAAAALRVAAILGPEKIKAVVSRGGRPDLAEEGLPSVLSPTLLLVGELDDIVIELNRIAYQKLGGVKKMEIIPGATHLFEEPGMLEMVADKAVLWFKKYLK